MMRKEEDIEHFLLNFVYIIMPAKIIIIKIKTIKFKKGNKKSIDAF